VEPTVDEAPDTRRGPVRLLSVVTLVVLLVASVAAAWATRQVVRDQEHRLLTERTSEINLILGLATSTVQSNLANAGTAAKLTGGSQAAFVDATRQDVATTPGLQAVALLGPAPDGSASFVVEATDGPAFKVGDVISGPRTDLMRKALGAGGQLAATSPALTTPSGQAVGIAAGPPLAPAGKVLYRETLVAPPGQSRTAAAAPFSELNVVLYTTKTATAGLALTTTAKVPLKGDVVNQPFKIGVTPWLLSVSAKQPLVGSLAARTPWLVLAGGILGALLMSYLIEVVLRRRDYALALVDERTAALRTSLDALESAQEQLVRQERLAAVGQLASAVGHELRNPLGVISNSLYLIRGATADTADERLHRHVSTAEREVSAATLIISDLLDFARSREPIITNVDVENLVDEALEVAPPPAGISVVRENGSSVAVVAADRDQLRQVLLNLITNGYDAMAEGGELRVSTAAVGGRVDIKIADNGSGIDGDARGRLFEPFFTTKARGVGLGLAVTQRIVGAHDGSIAVDSQPGEGTTFTVSLPAFVATTATG
jgi:signal transduction histidine kinase